ncbi:Glutamine ABC transporter, permease protein GlnP [Olavius algarvensis associated proteobacterium Delta 3]|nr:Glutamine ABC transporter, permease protein GlnP [Olavius algarvensis associated proteobacterium Delta 3]CAB5103043.1 Glutamine ABC transporter, permease protein GlnP [Olavius algarvensis associated proteobacterium Delta 3]
MGFEFKYIVESIPALIEGAKLTWYITIIGITGGMVLGTVAGLLRLTGTRAVGGESYGFWRVLGVVGQKLAIMYIELIRGTPIIVQAMFIYFALPMLIEVSTGIKGVRFNALTAAIITIIINAGAYMAEIVRGAVESVNKGLIEAGMAMGISRLQLIANIIGPIAFKRAIPPLGNQFIISLKDTSLFIVIGVGELTRQGQEIMASNFRALEIWTAVAVCYLIMTSALALMLKFVEKRMQII